MSRVSCQKGPTRHAYAWQIGPFWQDTLDVWTDIHGLMQDSGISITNALEISQQDDYAWDDINGLMQDFVILR